MTSRKRTITELGAGVSSSSAKATRIDTPEEGGVYALSRAQLDLADAVYRRAHFVAFRPVFLRRISTFYPLQWGEFIMETHDALSFDIRKHLDRFISLPQTWLTVLELAQIDLTTIKGDKDAGLYIKFDRTDVPPRRYTAGVEVMEAVFRAVGLQVRTAAVLPDRQTYVSPAAAMRTILIWIQMMFQQANVSINFSDDKIVIDQAAEYADALCALLVDAGAQNIRLRKNVVAQ